MKRFITGYLTIALLSMLGASDPAAAAGFLPTKGPPPAGPDGNTLVWRVQLLVQVCDQADAACTVGRRTS